MATPNQPQLSDSQLAELEKLARAQERSVDEMLSEAVDRYSSGPLYQGQAEGSGQALWCSEVP